MKNIDLIELKDAVLDSWEVENIDIFHREKYLILDFKEYLTDPTEEYKIKIKVLNPEDPKDLTGIHLTPDSFEDLENLLLHSIGSAFRDGFRNIYIHLK